MLNGLIFLVVGYVVYRGVIVRIRWRIVRVLFYVPILVFVLAVMSLVTAIDQANQAPSIDEVTAQIVDEMFVERADLRVSVNGAGTLQPIRQVPLAFQSVGQVAEINVPQGASVKQGDIIAQLNTQDLQTLLEDADLAFSLQESTFNALVNPPREVDLEAAQAALDAARAQYYAASATAPSEEQRQIADLQTQLARTRFWQLQIQRDNAVVPEGSGGSFSLIPPIDASQFGSIPTEVEDAIRFVNGQIGDLNGTINGATSALTEQTRLSVEAQRRSLEDSLDDAETSIFVAEASSNSVANRGADTGALASARLGIIQAQIALDRLVNGADELQLAQANTDLQLARLVREQAQSTIDQATLRAPFNGIVAQNNLKVGELPPQGIGVLLMDTSAYVVDLPVDETDVVKLREGQRVVFIVDALPDAEVTGIVTRIAYTPVRIGQLVTYTVRITLEPTQNPLRVGMSVTANIIIEERQNALTIRNRFIRIDNITRDAFVTVQNEDGTFSEVMVLLGERNETASEVLSGLEEGQRVVLLPRGTAGVTGIFGQ